MDETEHSILHSDHGCHYRWPGWISRMNQACLVRSMSAKGCSPDNAACEGFFGRLKNEMYYGKSWIYTTRDEFIDVINNYIKWYNEKRIKLTLGAMRPMDYRRSLGFIE
ncbi:IS3 family transposase [Anaerotignum propionicum]|uniref:IS3 family transposase n=1 Tax=Anaerotignum propionicum TaxID=28446 RepID=UPI00289F763C|nr:IS3 family transposase [Anaerotignum propionicum]